MTSLYIVSVLAGIFGASHGFICPESDGHFQHETHCDKYYWCVGSVPHTTSCPPGSYYSTVTKFCNWPYAVSHCSDTGLRTDVSGAWAPPQAPPQPQQPQQPPHGHDQHLHSWEQDGGSKWNNQDSWDQPQWDSYMGKVIKGAVESKHRTKRQAQQKAVTAGFKCTGDDGFYRHATECQLYWRCINSIEHLQRCAGLYFDPVIERCSWKYSVHDCNSDGKRTFI